MCFLVILFWLYWVRRKHVPMLIGRVDRRTIDSVDFPLTRSMTCIKETCYVSNCQNFIQCWWGLYLNPDSDPGSLMDYKNLSINVKEFEFLYVTSTLTVYLIPNLVYIHMCVWFVSEWFVGNFSGGFKYSYLILIIPFNINLLFAYS